MKFFSVLFVVLKGLAEFFFNRRALSIEAEAKEDVRDDIRLADQAEALRIERSVSDVPRELPADKKHTRRGRRPTPPDGDG